MDELTLKPEYETRVFVNKAGKIAIAQTGCFDDEQIVCLSASQAVQVADFLQMIAARREEWEVDDGED